MVSPLYFTSISSHVACFTLLTHPIIAPRHVVVHHGGCVLYERKVNSRRMKKIMQYALQNYVYLETEKTFCFIFKVNFEIILFLLLKQKQGILEVGFSSKSVKFFISHFSKLFIKSVIFGPYCNIQDFKKNFAT